MSQTAIVKIVFIMGLTMNVFAEEKIEVRVKRRLVRTVDIGDQRVDVPPFQTVDVEIRNRSKEAIPLRWNIHVSQVFVPIVRDSTGKVVSSEASFDLASPRREVEIHTIPPGGVHRLSTHPLFETVPQERRRKGTYTVKLWLPPIDETKPESVLGKSWESNEITVDWDGK